MDRLIWVAMTGARHAADQQAVVANNLANAATPGFKEELAASRAVRALGGDGYLTRTFTLAQSTLSNFTPGPMETTGRTLDLAIGGEGFFTVQTPGGEAYTRGGSLDIDPNRVLRTKLGAPILTTTGETVTVPENSEIHFAFDGTITAVRTDNPTQPTPLGKLKLVNEDWHIMDRGSDGLFRPRHGQPLPPDPKVKSLEGMLEGSNVNPVLQLTKMIDYQRNYDLQLRMIQSADENAKTAGQIISFA